MHCSCFQFAQLEQLLADVLLNFRLATQGSFNYLSHYYLSLDGGWFVLSEDVSVHLLHGLLHYFVILALSFR